MKSISASIVILAGVSAMTASGFISHGDTQAFVGIMGGLFALAGLAVWIWSLQHDNDQ